MEHFRLLFLSKNPFYTRDDYFNFLGTYAKKKIKRCAPRQNMYIIASLQDSLPPPPPQR